MSLKLDQNVDVFLVHMRPLGNDPRHSIQPIKRVSVLHVRADGIGASLVRDATLVRDAKKLLVRGVRRGRVGRSVSIATGARRPTEGRDVSKRGARGGWVGRVNQCADAPHGRSMGPMGDRARSYMNSTATEARDTPVRTLGSDARRASVGQRRESCIVRLRLRVFIFIMKTARRRNHRFLIHHRDERALPTRRGGGGRATHQPTKRQPGSESRADWWVSTAVG